MKGMEEKQRKHIGSIPVVLFSKETSIKVGKINESINTDRCVITKEPQGKNFKVIEKKQQEEVRYSGSLMAEQSSKYLIMQYNSETGKMEVTPAGDWYSFRKDINYQTMSLEEAEEKMKGKSVLLEYIRNRGVTTKPKKEKKVTSEREEVSRGGRVPLGRLNDEDEDMEDEVRPKLTERIEEQSEEEREEDIDPDLKDIPSDIEEGFIKGKKTKSDNLQREDALGLDTSSDDALFGGDDDAEDEDDAADDEDPDDEMGFSEIDKEEDLTPEQDNSISLNTSKKSLNNITNTSNISNTSNIKDQDFVGHKRKSEASVSSHNSDTKKHRSSPPMEEYLNILFSRNKKMTYDKIVKELSRDFNKEEINSHLPSLLNRMCEKFQQNSEHYYFKKSDKH